jgi:hypothetical protein
MTEKTDEFGLPVRYNRAAGYRGRAVVVYGHPPVPQPDWRRGPRWDAFSAGMRIPVWATPLVCRGPCQGLNPYLSAHGACSDCMLFFLSDPRRRLRWTFCFH